ncbi:MAG: serine hydrolase, partial [Caulobacterales bacterium 32-67-6]
MTLPSLPTQPAQTPWPTAQWPQGQPEHADGAVLEALMATAFATPDTELLGETHAALIVQGGRVVLERYGEGFGPEATYPSWSKAKSITQALVGLLVAEGKL